MSQSISTKETFPGWRPVGERLSAPLDGAMTSAMSLRLERVLIDGYGSKGRVVLADDHLAAVTVRADGEALDEAARGLWQQVPAGAPPRARACGRLPRSRGSGSRGDREPIHIPGPCTRAGALQPDTGSRASISVRPLEVGCPERPTIQANHRRLASPAVGGEPHKAAGATIDAVDAGRAVPAALLRRHDPHRLRHPRRPRGP